MKTLQRVQETWNGQQSVTDRRADRQTGTIISLPCFGRSGLTKGD